MNFNDIQLHFPNIEKIQRRYRVFLEEFKKADNAKDVEKLISKINKFESNLSSNINIIYIRYTIDTTNQEYKNAMQTVNEISPLITECSCEIIKEILNKPFKDELEKKYGKFLFQKYENSLLSFDKKIINDLIEENKLVNQHDEILGNSKVIYKDKEYSIAQLGKFIESTDRNTRYEVSKLIEKFFKDNDKQLGEIYSNMVIVRDRMAKKLGYTSYVDFAYKLLGRTDYNKENIKNYRKQLYKTVVPIYKKLIKQQAKLIEIKNPQFYDLNLYFKNGNPAPHDNIIELTKKANKMYHLMSKETGEFFQMMMDSNLLSLEATKGKLPGGYMTSISKYKVPFIFANSNGTSQDVETLTHEVGHAFQYYCARNIKVPEYVSPTLEACEIHSMSMEFLTWPWMDLFFGDDAEKFKYQHLANSICFIPYMALVDEFQHFVYENVNITHEERCAKWRELEKKWLPLKKYSGFNFYNKGTWWLKQNHIFSSPFYYIDYSLAQVVAYQFLNESLKNRGKTWNKYVKLCKLGGKYPFQTLLEKAHLRNPFIDGNVKKNIRPLIKLLKEFDVDKLNK